VLPKQARTCRRSGSAVNGQPAGVPGSFTFGSLAGNVLPAGTSSARVTFNPADGTDYTSVAMLAQVTVTEAPSITSAAAAAFTAGTPGTFAVTCLGFPAPRSH